MRTRTVLLLAALGLITAVGAFVFAKSQAHVAASPLVAMTPAAAAAALPEGTSDEVRQKTREYMEYEQSIQLNAEQQKIKEAALTPIPAACCSDNSALTCCCPCNLSRTVWGLTAHLIANEGIADASVVQSKVEAWLEQVKGPEGFSGDTCYTGGCGRPFHQNGCGGMNPSRVAF